ncbi:MAG: SpoIIE family protein phosphatase [Verrucomicrobia bacterium]|nr:SpoIIE family protein phosphatase [Verrucomicrobiota bacterium]
MDDRYATKELLANLLNHSSDNIYFKDLESHIILVNDAFARWVGRKSPDDLVGMSDFDLFKDEHARPAFEDEQRIIETHEPLLGVEEREVWSDGRVTWVSTSKMPLFDDQGEIMGTFGVSRDITAHKVAEQKLAKYAEELEHLNRQIQDDIAMADRFQKAFLPQAYPRFARDGEARTVEFGHYYKAGGHIGGDFCAIRKLSDHKTAILVCDVMGHGVRSALVTGIVRALSEDLLCAEQDPGVLLSRMNRQIFPMLRQSEDFVFLTACCIVLDVQSGVLQYANAGHPPPLYLKGGQSPRPLSISEVVEQPAIPLFEETQYTTCEVELSPNDMVFIYTDGLVEAEDDDQNQYGVDRLIDSLLSRADGSVTSILSGLAEDAARFSSGPDFEDDVCMAGLRFFGSPA